ncbi:MAG TPA: glycosyl hydrolase family 5, partial [Bacillota bacterium]|nr:glycosyl hydrolase family 5 [Bacillota bacterium]
MKSTFVQAKQGEFFLEEKPIVLRGFAVGSWMNFEHFMLRIPGTEKKIRRTFAEVYGVKNAAHFFDDFLTYFLAEEDFIFLKSLGV